MAYPTDDLTTVNLDAATDNPSQARAELLAAIQKIQAIIAATGIGANNALKLDSNGKVPTGVALADAVSVASGGTGAATAAVARTNLGVDAAGTDNSTAVTKTGESYLTLTGQALTALAVTLSGTHVAGILPAAKVAVLPAGNLGANSVNESKLDWANFKGVSQVTLTSVLDTTATTFNTVPNSISYIYIPANATTLNYTAVYNVNITATNCYLRIKTSTKTGTSLGLGTNIGNTTTYVAFGTNPTGTLDVSDIQGTLAKITIEGYTDTAGTVRFRNINGYFT